MITIAKELFDRNENSNIQKKFKKNSKIKNMQIRARSYRVIFLRAYVVVESSIAI